MNPNQGLQNNDKTLNSNSHNKLQIETMCLDKGDNEEEISPPLDRNCFF